jgi:hypothetical protein
MSEADVDDAMLTAWENFLAAETREDQLARFRELRDLAQRLRGETDDL